MVQVDAHGARCGLRTASTSARSVRAAAVLVLGRRPRRWHRTQCGLRWRSAGPPRLVTGQRSRVRDDGSAGRVKKVLEERPQPGLVRRGSPTQYDADRVNAANMAVVIQ